MHGVLLNFGIPRHQRELFRLRLRDQHTVERVKVYRRQSACAIGVLQRDFQRRKPVAFDFFEQRIRCVEFAQRLFDGNFPY